MHAWEGHAYVCSCREAGDLSPQPSPGKAVGLGPVRRQALYCPLTSLELMNQGSGICLRGRGYRWLLASMVPCHLHLY